MDNAKPKERFLMYELFNYADGNDDILTDAGGGQDIRRGMWAQMPYSVSDGPAVFNEEFIISEDIPDVHYENLNDRGYSDKLAREVAGKLGLTLPKYLGGGGNGFAYTINNNLVLKLTTDISEADAASKLMRGRPVHIATIFNLYKVVDTDENKSVYVIMQENITDKPLQNFRKIHADISKIKPDGLDYEDILSDIRKPKKFDYNQVIEFAKKIITDNPEAKVSEVDRQAAYDFLISIFEIRKELLEFGIKSTDYVEIANLGYKDGVLKFFDTGGYHGVSEPDFDDNDIISLPEGAEGQLEEDYSREKADNIANKIATKIGIQEPRYLGHGTIGVAYDIGDKKVLKITADNSEAYENLKLVGRKLNYIADTYRVFEVVPKNAPEEYRKTYGIILEKLVTDVNYFTRMHNRLDYVFNSIFDTDYREALDSYSDGHQYNDEAVDKEKIDAYFKKNSEDGEFFYSILRIAEELRTYGINSYDFYNPENLGYKPSGVIGFFDVGFTDGFAQPHGAEKMSVELEEDGSSLFSTDSEMGQDGFPAYTQGADTSPSINNDLDANIAMYEDLEYNHVDGDATDDKYMLSEVTVGGEYQAYHGSETKIDKFVDDFVGKEEATDQEGPGIYFSTNIEDARAYGEYIHSVILTPRELVDEKSHMSIPTHEIKRLIMMSSDWKTTAQNWDENPNRGLEIAIQSTYEYAKNEKDLFQQIWYDWFRYEPLLYVRGMVMLGYDGQIIEKADGNKHFIVYNPNIIEVTSAEPMNERDKSFGAGSKTVKVKKKCQLGGKGDGTSVACNQGDINNLEFGSVNEVVAKTQEEVDSFIGGSKVKETVYHGSPVGGIEDFKKPKGGSSDGQVVVSSGLREDAIYFTSNPKLADVYKGKKLNPEFKQEIERQIRVMYDKQMTVRNNRDYDAINDEIEKLRNKLNGEVYGVKLNIKNPLIFDGKGKSNSLAGSGWNELEIDLGYKAARGKEAVNLIATKHDVAKNYWKYDGIIGKNIIELDSYTNKPDDSNSEYLGNVYAVFSPNQILVLGPELMKDDTPRNDMYFNKLSSVNENDLEVTEYFSSLVPDMNEDIMSIQDLPFKEEVEQLGGKIFSVGGAVRDEFLGLSSKDLDVLISGVPIDKLQEVLSKYGRVSLEGDSFAVLIFTPKGSTENMDIAIPRTETPTGGGGHQDFDVKGDHTLPIEKDLERRDITINAIAKDMDGNIIDPFGGQEDLKSKIIRVVNPDAFSDDPLRMLRAVQFASRFDGFQIEPKTMQMIVDSAGDIKKIKAPRLLIEFGKIITKGNPRVGVELLASTGLFKQIFGNEIQASQIGGRNFEGVKTMAEFLFLMMDGVVQNPSQFYLSRFSTEDAKRDKIFKEIVGLERGFDAVAENQQMTPVQARSVAHNMFDVAPQTLQSQVLPQIVGTAAQELAQGKYPKTVNELAVNGHDLMQKGLKGSELGKMQKSMLIKVYADIVRNDKEDLLSLVDSEGEIQEGDANYNELKPTVWRINDKEVGIDFFVKKYDSWNTQGGVPAYRDASKESVLEFLQNNYEDFSTDEKLNKELYWKLTDRDLLGEEEVKKVRYSAVVLDKKSSDSLLKVFGPMIPEGWETFAHHMTIKMGALENGSKEKDDLSGGTVITLNVTDYAIDNLVMAAGVDGYSTTNEKPHITIAVNREEGGKPYLSNKLTDWKPLGFPLKLTGKVTEVI